MKKQAMQTDCCQKDKEKPDAPFVFPAFLFDNIECVNNNSDAKSRHGACVSYHHQLKA